MPRVTLVIEAEVSPDGSQLELSRMGFSLPHPDDHKDILITMLRHAIVKIRRGDPAKNGVLVVPDHCFPVTSEDCEATMREAARRSLLGLPAVLAPVDERYKLKELPG